MAGQAGSRTIKIAHINDVYDIAPRAADPVGGAARMATKIRGLGPDTLVLFSGDAFNPSLLSTITQGRQMVEVLNAFGVAAACVGNHDFDYGLDSFVKLAGECRFPWLMANVLDAASGRPLGGAQPSMLLEWRGVKLGLMGLVEREWLTTLASIDPEDVTYLDFVPEGARLAAELRAQGAEVVIALTHMRLPNDLRLAQSVPGIDLVLGGHDHEYYLLNSERHDVAVVKSGTDFRDLTEIHLALTPPAAAAAAAAAPGSPRTPRSLVVSARLAPGRVEDCLAELPKDFARLALRAHQRTRRWAHLAGIPALAGCSLRALPVGPAPGSGDDADGTAGAAAAGAEPEAAAAEPASPAGGGENATAEGRDAAAIYEASAAASLATSLLVSRPAGGAGAGPAATQLSVMCVRHAITADIEEDAEVAAIVERYAKVMGERLDEVIGHTATDLDGRFATVRTGESNLGNFICDIWREACAADASLCNGGTFRSDRVHPAGALTHRDMVSVLPMLDETVVVEVTGAQLLGALENGVSEWPKHEGRFPQISGMRFAFDPSKPPGQRVVPGSVTVGEQPLDPGTKYSLATKAYLAQGRDGYEALVGAPLLRDCDSTPLLPQVVSNHFLLLRTAQKYVETTGRLKAWHRAAERLLAGSESYPERSQQRLQAAGRSVNARRHPLTGRWEIAPVVDGRIQRVGGSSAAGAS